MIVIGVCTCAILPPFPKYQPQLQNISENTLPFLVELSFTIILKTIGVLGQNQFQNVIQERSSSHAWLPANKCLGKACNLGAFFVDLECAAFHKWVENDNCVWMLANSLHDIVLGLFCSFWGAKLRNESQLSIVLFRNALLPNISCKFCTQI